MNERIKQCWISAAQEDSGEKWDTQVEFIERVAKNVVNETIKEICQQMHWHGMDQSNNPTFYKVIDKTMKEFGMLPHNEQKIKDIADECFSVMPDWKELMLFLKLASKVVEKDADEWYEKALWEDKGEKL